MDIDKPNAAESYTILRIKRKRTEEPLDALVVESRVRRKKSRGGIGMFQFAQTVEQDAWEDEQRRKALQDEISRLTRETANRATSQSTAPSLQTSTSLSSAPRQPKDDSNRRYTIIQQDDPEDEKLRQPTSPPKVVSYKDLPPKARDFRMYDAILSGENVPSLASDPEMDKFLPMLNDYLKLHDIPPPVAGGGSGQLPISNSPSGDYVWDVFYHRPATLSEWNEAANVGTLTGLPPSISDPYDSDSDSEVEDEADEDSNAEEYYKNDYPDEESGDESGSSDEFHEHSDHDDIMQDRNSDDFDWR